MKPKKAILMIIIFLLVFSFTITSAFAYSLCGYELIGGPDNRQYCVVGASVTQDGTTVDYGSVASSAVLSWNAINTTSSSDVDVAFSKISGVSGAEIIFMTTNRGANGWSGFTYYHDANGNYINEGGYPNKNYTYCSVLLNTHYLQGRTNQRRINVCAHEMGHALGLMHGPSGSLMESGISSVTTLRKPQADDIAGVRSIYE